MKRTAFHTIYSNFQNQDAIVRKVICCLLVTPAFFAGACYARVVVAR